MNTAACGDKYNTALEQRLQSPEAIPPRRKTGSVGLGIRSTFAAGRVLSILLKNGLSYSFPKAKKFKVEAKEFGADAPQVTARASRLMEDPSLEISIV